MSRFILALDQGTTSSRAFVFRHDPRVQPAVQMSHRLWTPCPERPGPARAVGDEHTIPEGS